ncbi:MAG: LCP family protein [Candidatus Eremiobacteraeota bacterium]|nr:LCP family protein [Candidatus Eremiobacteraeota bacterium]
MRYNWKRIIICLVILFIIGVIAIGIGFIYSTGKEKQAAFIDIVRMVVKPGKIAFKGKDSLKILVLGLDYNYTEKGIPYTKGSRSDTVFVVRVDSEGKNLNILSIPRDVRVKLADGYGYDDHDRINAAYSLGGLPLAMATVEKFLETDIDHYVIIRSYSLKDLVDAIGGVAVDVEKDMDYDDNWGHFHVHLKKGPQILNGEQAVGYCRFRNDAEGDRGRIRRQQQFITALVKDLKKPSNLVKVDKIARAFKKLIETDMSVFQLIDLAKVYRDFNLKNISTGVIDGTDDIVSETSVIIPDEKRKDFLVQHLLEGKAELDPEKIKIQVLNGCGIDGIAAQMADLLKQHGFKVIDVGNAMNFDYELTEIIDYNSRPQMAMTIMDIIGKAQLLRDNSGLNEELDFTIIIGRDWQQPASSPSPIPEESPGEET